MAGFQYFISTPVNVPVVIYDLECRLHGYANKQVKDEIDSMVLQMKRNLNLSNTSLSSVYDSENVKQKVVNLFQILDGTEKLAPGTLHGALDTLINLEGLEKLSKQIHQRIETRFNCKIERRRTRAHYEWNHGIPPAPPFYIPRKLSLRNRIDPSIFEENVNDVFLIGGMELHEISTLADKTWSFSARSSTQLKMVTVRFILLERIEDFGSISSCTAYPVHVIEVREGLLYWKKSKGSLELIQKYIHPENETFSEHELLEVVVSEFTTTPICIADLPGMGKSFLLAQLARELQQTFPERVVLFFQLKDVVKQLVALEDDFEEKDVFALISKARVSSPKPRCSMVEEDVHFEIFFDGFDEIQQNQHKAVIEVLKKLTTMKCFRLYVTTRRHMRDELEEALGVIGINMMQFDEDAQIEFLRNHWILGNQAEDNKRLLDFARECLEHLAVNDVNKEYFVAGIPLQCFLLAEVHASAAVRCSKGWGYVEPLFTSNSIFDMYNELMKLKFQRAEEEEKIEDEAIFNSKGKPRCQMCSFFGNTNHRDDSKLFHIFTALSTLYPKSSITLNCIRPRETPLLKLYALGLMEPSSVGKKGKVVNNPIPKFIHATFAEYLVAEYLANEMFSCRSCFQFLLQNLFQDPLRTEERYIIKQTVLYGTPIETFHFESPVIIYFLEGHLKRRAVQDYSTAFSFKVRAALRKSALDCFKSSMYFELLNAFAVKDFVECHRLLSFIIKECWQKLRLTFQIDGVDNIMKRMKEAFLLASKHTASKVVLDNLRELYADLFGLPMKSFESIRFSQPIDRGSLKGFLLTPLHVATDSGNFGMVEYFLKIYELREMKFLLHVCLYRSAEESDEIINAKVQIIKLLIKKYPLVLNEICIRGQTPILQSYVHPKLIICLVEQGASVNDIDDLGESLLHKIWIDSKSNIKFEGEYLKLLDLVEELGYQHWNRRNDYGQTPLKACLRTGALPNSTLCQRLSIYV